MLEYFNGRPLLNFISCSSPDICGDIVETYRLAAERLGYKSIFSENILRNDALNIVFFCWNSPWSEFTFNHQNTIIVNFEPMIVGTHSYNKNYLDTISKCYLWEYSRTNFQRWEELNFRVANYVPIGYESGAASVLPLDDLLPDHEQDIDVIFFGTLTQRRVDLLNKLMDMGLNVVVNRIWEGESWTIDNRNSLLRRSKVALNFHNWENSRIVEVPRLATLFRQRKAVVCELYPDSEIDPVLRNAVIGASYDGLVDAVIELLKSPDRRKQMEIAALSFIESLEKRKFISVALERFIDWRENHKPAGEVTPNLTAVICGYIDCVDEYWLLTLNSICSDKIDCQWVLTVSENNYNALFSIIRKRDLKGVSIITIPNGVDKGVGLNIALHQVNADLVLFCEKGDVGLHYRVENLKRRLQISPTIDIVVDNDQSASSVAGPSFEESHEITASLLGSNPLSLSRCLIRKKFIDFHGILHSSELGLATNLYFLCRCAASGAMFSGVVEKYTDSCSSTFNLNDMKSENLSRLNGLARHSLLSHVFPHLTHLETDLLKEIYAYNWAADPDFASTLLNVIANACVKARHSKIMDKESLSRIFRKEVHRLISVFYQARLIDQDWIDQQFSVPEVAYFLSPLSPQLPLRPSASQKGSPDMGKFLSIMPALM